MTRFPAFLLSVFAALPFTLLTPRQIPPVQTSYLSTLSPGESWEHGLWLPCALSLIPLQAVSALEAFFALGGRYKFTPSVSVALGMFSGVACLAFARWPQGDMVGQLVQVARLQRVGCSVFLLLACAWFGSVAARDLLTLPEGRHLLLIACWSLTWMVPILRPIPPTWAEWLRVDWMLAARFGVLVLWLGSTYSAFPQSTAPVPSDDQHACQSD